MKTKTLRNLKSSQLIKECVELSDIALLCVDAGFEAMDIRDQILEIDRIENELRRRVKWN
jgi:hypothetical protein